MQGWAFPEPSRAPTRGGTVVTVHGFGMEEEEDSAAGRYQCVFTRDGTYGLPDEQRAVHHTPYTLHPQPSTPNPQPSTLNPTPYTLHP